MKVWDSLNGRWQEPNLFEDTFKKSDITTVPWSLTLANAATLTLDSTAGLHMTDGQTMKFLTGTSSSSEFHRYVAKAPGARYVGVEWVFATMGEEASNFAFYVSHRDSTNWIRAKILHVNATNVWSYQNSAGSQISLLTRDTNESASVPRWHRVFGMIDIKANTYASVTIDEQDFTSTVNGQALRSSADVAGSDLLDIAVESTNTASPQTIYFDSIRAFQLSGNVQSL